MTSPARATTWLSLLLLAAVLTAEGASAAEVTSLRFERDGELLRAVPIEELRAGCGERRIEVDDPYYGTRKSYLACPLAPVLDLGFGSAAWRRADANFFLRARDGYVRPAAGATLAEPGGHLAFADAALGSGFHPIDRRQVDPGPLYLVWEGASRNDPHRYPWPYQLAAIEMARFESRYPHTPPAGVAAGATAWAGFATFRRECISCHAINGEGGTVGPELNVPRSIVEYRPAAQIKAYIRDPASFRYTSMPAHPHLSDADLDALVAYFEAMAERKRDPYARPGATGNAR